jgi:Ca2+-binding RTX toxin-like protein
MGEHMIETLESRFLLAATVMLDAGGVLKIVGTSRADTMGITQTTRIIRVSILQGAILRSFPTASVNKIEITGLGGVDAIGLSPFTRTEVRVPTKIDGGKGDDRILTGRGPDTILGGSGNDIIDGANGNDSITGGSGNDSIFGSGGDDSILGGGGADQIFGDFSFVTKDEEGNGNDTINGGAGIDLLDGDGGDDVLNGGPDHDTLNGGPGVDDLQTSGGNDLLSQD